jgi:hypothetical protein
MTVPFQQGAHFIGPQLSAQCEGVLIFV